jgi:hypothetical protein
MENIYVQQKLLPLSEEAIKVMSQIGLNISKSEE